MTSVTKTHASHAVHCLLESFTIQGRPSQPEEVVDQIVAEALRHYLWMLSQHGTLDGLLQPVYITRLTNSVRRQLGAIWPSLSLVRNRHPSEQEQQAEGELHPDSIRRVLEALYILQDVEDLGGGYWIPTPIRLVELPIGDEVMVVGGVDLSHLRREISPYAHLNGIMRFIKRSHLSSGILNDRANRQPFRQWLGNPPEDLREWVTSILRSASAQLAPSAAELTGFEVYLPRQRPSQPQYFRWVSREEIPKPPGDLVLCRTIPHPSRPSRFWLGTLTDSRGECILKQEAPLLSKHVRRMMYGLDLLAGTPTRAIVKDAGDGVVITLRSWLPAEERRLFTALARDESSNPGRLPAVFGVKPEYKGQIFQALSGLGIVAIV